MRDGTINKSMTRTIRWRWIREKGDTREAIVVYRVVEETGKLEIGTKGLVKQVDILYELPKEKDAYNQEIWTAPYIVVDNNVYPLNDFKEVRRDYIEGLDRIIEQ